LGNCRIAAVGKKTAEAIAGYRLRADFVADGMSGESLAAGLIRGAETPGADGPGDPARRAAVLWVRASRGPDTVGQRLRDAGMRVTAVNAYRHEDIASADESLIAKLAAGEIDWVTVTSDAIAKSLDRLFGAGLARARLAALSPAIARTLEGLGLRVDALAIEPTMAGVVEAILAKEVEGSRKN
jgi:uroporphyrinogen III methyltransferase/synthase